MREFLLPIIGAILLVVGVTAVLVDRSQAVPALVLEVAGVILLGIFIAKGIMGKHTRR